MTKRLLTSDEIKEIELEILLEFSNFCKQNNLRFYLAYGTLLGAVRHKGFIPWDDDIDVVMPRPDYERFLEIYSSVNGNYFLRTKSLGNFNAPFTKLVSKNTVIESRINDGHMDTNLWIDIFPIDGLPDSMSLTKKLYAKIDLYVRIIMLIHSKFGIGGNTLKKYAKYLFKPIAMLYGHKRCIKNIEKLVKVNNYSDCNYVGMISWMSGGAEERMLRTDFEQGIEVEFEGHKFPAFSCWERYLIVNYGDYMQLPPVEERHTHNFVAYQLW